MEIDSDSEQSTTTKKQIEALKALASGPLSSSTSKLSTCLRGIPSDEDFHFFYNFNEFKNPIKQIITNIESTLEAIGSNTNLLGKKLIFPKNDVDEAYDWLVNLNDEVYERFDVSIDEFRKVRRMEEESGKRVGFVEDQDGFQLVQGRKKKGGRSDMSVDKNEGEKLGASSSSVKSVSRDSRASGSKTRVPFHIPSITKPQTQFKILVNNSNEPFEHVWLQKSEDGSRFIHPLESFSELDFIDRNISDVEPVKPLPTESTPFKLIEEVRDLKDLAAKLRDVNEFAVDLEHNHYRSFQGLTCLMQISTRSEDFVVDTLKLHAHIGPQLREVFKDPSKKKVMHGADRDVLWFQRDFGIYICNLFDTGQASRVLKLERNSLEYLLHHFCGVTANKEYQSADWRLRPIPDEMLRYAREDTHYLLHIYDLIRVRLLEASTSSENADDLLLEVYKRSYDICMQLYKKETLTATSYLNIYGLHEADFSSQQLAVVAGLCEWRDGVARAEDESTGFILPNRALLEIAKQMPLTAGKLRQLLRSNHLHVECNLGSIVSVVKRSIDNASAFEIIAEQLQKARKDTESAEPTIVADEDEASQAAENPAELVAVPNNCIEDNSLGRIDMETANCTTTSDCVKDEPMEVAGEGIESGTCGQAGQFKTEQNGHAVELPQKFVPSGPGQVSTEASVKVSKKPSGAFGALFGKSSSKRKLGTDPKVNVKVEQIKSSVTLPFHSFRGGSGQAEALPKERTVSSNQHPGESVSAVSDSTNLEDIIPLANDIDHQQESVDVSAANDCEKPNEQGSPTATNDCEKPNEQGSPTVVELNTGDKHMSLSELSSSFQDCLQSMNQKRGNGRVEKPREPESKVELKPFDYAAAREQIQFGENRKDKETQSEEGHKNLLHSKERRKNSVSSRAPREEGTKDSQQARRRMAFPPTGNRSVTFR